MNWRKRYLGHLRRLGRSGRQVETLNTLGTVTFVDVPVINGIATLPDGRQIASSSHIVRVPILA